MGHDLQVVGDKQHRQAKIRLQVHEQVQDLRLDRDIQRRGRLVQHQKPGVQRQGAGDGHALGLPAGQLTRASGQEIGRQSATRKQRGGPLAHLGAGRVASGQKRFRQDLRDGQARAERQERVLRHHPDRPARAAQFGAPDGQPIAAIEGDAAALNGHQPQDGAQKAAFARPGFAHHAQCGPAGQRQTDPVHRRSLRRGKQAARLVADHKVLNLKKGGGHRGASPRWQIQR